MVCGQYRAANTSSQIIVDAEQGGWFPYPDDNDEATFFLAKEPLPEKVAAARGFLRKLHTFLLHYFLGKHCLSRSS
jgi:hypothetical protein